MWMKLIDDAIKVGDFNRYLVVGSDLLYFTGYEKHQPEDPIQFRSLNTSTSENPRRSEYLTVIQEAERNKKMSLPEN